MIAISTFNFNYVDLKEKFSMISKKIGIIGGDMRQYYLAKSLKKDGHDIKITGFENLITETDSLKTCSLTETTNFADYIILPIPMSRDGAYINAPHSETKISIDTIFKLKNKKIFGGTISPKQRNEFDKTSKIYDFYREDFTILNAVPTAEGAIKEAFKYTDKTLSSCKCLVTGYGKIGKVLCTLLKNMGAEVTAAMRSNKDFAWAYTQGIKSVNINEFKTDYDIIFNTAPAMIFNKKILEKIPHYTLIIDLASEPGGIDKAYAKKLGINSIQALGLPGKYFPKTAGKIIKTVIYKIIEEENL